MNKQGKFFSTLCIVLFLTALGGGLLLSLALPLRPAYSETEKRKLAEFPPYSLSALANGSYFDGIDRWFSDTFPFRDELVTWDGRIRALYGFSPIRISGSVESGDDIPGEGDEPAQNDEPEQPAEPGKKPFTDDDGVDENYHEPESTGEVQKFGAVLEVGDTGYEYYGFSESAAKRYAAMLKTAATLLDGRAQVYDMVVPNSMGVMLPDSLRGSVHTSDQEKALDYIYSLLDGSVTPVSIYAPLRAHRSEYIYFRTDHHWTALGAYYAYTKLADVKGWDAVALEQYQQVEYDNFLGSFYASTGKSGAMAKHPDTVVAYKPFYDYDFFYRDKTGSEHVYPLIQDVSSWAKGSKYSAFIGGDQPYSEVHNLTLHDGSACVVLKESYGNAFVPFLPAHYEHVYVLDYRYWDGSLKTLVEEKGISDVYFVNNIMAAQTGVRIGEMESLLH